MVEANPHPDAEIAGLFDMLARIGDAAPIEFPPDPALGLLDQRVIDGAVLPRTKSTVRLVP